MWAFAVSNCCMEVFLSLLLRVNQVQPFPASTFTQYFGEKGESSTLSSQSTSPLCRPSDGEHLDSEAIPFPLLATYRETPLLLYFWRAAAGESLACLGVAQLPMNVRQCPRTQASAFGTLAQAPAWYMKGSSAEQISRFKPEARSWN